MKDIHAVRGARYIHSLIAEGEHEHQDFKFAISDARKIARSISAFANNDGGRLLVGVKDNGVVAGVRNEEDIYVIEQAAWRYCRPNVPVEFKAYKVDGATLVIEAIIAAHPEPPVQVVESDGSLRAYYRVADENIVAHPAMVMAWHRRSRPLALTALHTAVTSAIEAAGAPLEIRDIALRLHATLDTATAAVADLAAAGVLRFVHVDQSFRVDIKQTEP